MRVNEKRGALEQPAVEPGNVRSPAPDPEVAGKPHRAGFVAIVGRANVGKSTLLNQILGTRLAIVSRKPQTTRHRIVGIKSLPTAQLVFVDTPGLHRPVSLLAERMVEVARKSLAEADVALWLVDAGAGLTPADRELAAELAGERRPLIVGLNKSDLTSKRALLGLAAEVAELLPGRDVVPLAAATGANVAELLRTVEPLLPLSPALYPADLESAYLSQNEDMTQTERRTLYEGSPSWRAYLGHYMISLFAGILVMVILDMISTGWQARAVNGVIAIAAVAVYWLAIMLKRKATKFRVTTTVIETERGLLSKRIDVLQLWRCRDVRYKQNLVDRILGIAHVEVFAQDMANPHVEIVGMPASRQLFEQLRDAIEIQRQAKNVVGVVS